MDRKRPAAAATARGMADLMEQIDMTKRNTQSRTCSVGGCERPHRAKGYCGSHYNQFAQPGPRHKRAKMSCIGCGAKVEKYPSGKRRPFCSFFCRDLYMASNGLGRWGEAAESRRVESIRKASAERRLEREPSWVGSFSPVAATRCRSCDSVFCHDARRQRRYCSKPCAEKARAIRRRGRSKIRRDAIFERDNYTCWICERRCNPRDIVPADLAPTVDHLIPRARGGSDDPENLATACFACNSKRGASWGWPTAA